MNERKFKIAVALSDVSKIDLLDFSRIDLIFAGNPHCYIRHNNPLKSVGDLVDLITKTNNYKDRLIVSLPVCPMESDMEHVDNILRTVSEKKIHGVEVHSPGMAMKVRNQFSDLKIYFGSYTNIYTHLCAAEMEKIGAGDGALPFELDLEEILFIKNNSNINLWLPVFGTYPISFSQYCYFHQDQNLFPYKCNYECENGTSVDFGEGKKIIHRGRAMFSDRCLNMLEHSEMLWDKGFRNFRIEGLFSDIESINDVAAIFYEFYNYVSGESPEKPDLKNSLKNLKKLAPEGFCNGFYWTEAGREYIR